MIYKRFYIGMALKAAIVSGAVLGSAQALPVFAEEPSQEVVEEPSIPAEENPENIIETTDNPPKEERTTSQEQISEPPENQPEPGRSEVNDKEPGNVVSSESVSEEPKNTQAIEDYRILDSEHSLTLEGDVRVNFYMLLSDDLATKEGAGVEFTVDKETTFVPTSAALLKEWNGQLYHRFTRNISSVQMTLPVKARFLLPDGTSIHEETYSAMQYAEEMFADENLDPDLDSLIKSMLNFGSHAQTYFDKNTEIRADASLSEIDKEIPAITPEQVQAYAAIKTGTLEGLRFVGSTLVLNSTTTIRHYFTVDPGRHIDEFTFRYGHEVLTPVEKAGMYYVAIENITSKNLDTPYTIQVGDYSIQYNALSYVYDTLKDERAPETLKELVRSLYVYNQRAKKYFETFDESLKKFLYRYEKNGVLDISKYDLTYREVNEKIKEITDHDKTLNMFVIMVNKGYPKEKDMSDLATTIRMMHTGQSNDIYMDYDLIAPVNKKIDEIVGGVNQKWSDFEKALYVHDWICLNAKYDGLGPNSHNIAGTLLDGRGVCQSFTYAAETILYRLGIPTVQIDGNGHTFLEVCLDGEWYMMDITVDNNGGLGSFHHICTFVSRDKYFASTSRDASKFQRGGGGVAEGSLATNPRYETVGDEIGLYQENMWKYEEGAFQYYDGYWYNGTQKYGKYDPRVGKYVISNEVWVYQYDKDTKEFKSVGVGLPGVTWLDTYRGLYIVEDTAITRTDDSFVKIDLKTGQAATLLKVKGMIKDYFVDHAGVVNYRIEGDSTVYTTKL